LFPTSGQVCVWRTPKEAYNPECLVPNVKHGGGFVIIWAKISWYYAGTDSTLIGLITSSDYMYILGKQVHLIVQTLFCKNYAIIQEENSPEFLGLVLRSMKMHFNSFSGQQNHHT
jgi:hypothetical protein